MSNQFIKDYYYECYNSEDKEGKRKLTQQINTILESIPPKDMAMAIVRMLGWNTSIRDAEELNKLE